MNRISGRELEYLQKVLSTEFRSSMGSVMTTRLEKAFADYFGCRYAISHINGTATMHSLLEAKGIGIGDEVIVPPLTMSSTSFAVLQANATPVFADIDPDTFLIDPKSIESRITEKTKAIITVSLYGLSPDMDRIMEIANAHKLFVIEDNAECLGGSYKGRKVGTLGHAASYSFQSSKHLTSGEGGMVITNDLELAENVRRVSSLGYAGVGAEKGKITRKDIQDPDYSRHLMMGWNYRMPELCAAVALAQLENMKDLIETRKKSAALFNEVIKSCNWLIPQKVENGYENTYWTFAVRLDHPRVDWNTFRDEFQKNGGDGIYAAWKLTYLEPMLVNRKLLGREALMSKKNLEMYKPGLCPVAERVQPKLLQFKTNYWNYDKCIEQAAILEKTVAKLDKYLG